MSGLREDSKERNKAFKESAAGFFDATKGVHTSLIIGTILFLVYLWLRADQSRTDFVLKRITTPYKRMMGAVCDLVPFSVMEVVILLTALLAVFVLVRGIVLTIKNKSKLTCVYKTIAFFAAAALLIWDGYCWLWGLNYYGESFSEKSGVSDGAVSVEELYETTAYYAEEANLLAGNVPRDGEGIFNEDLDTIFDDSGSIYAGIIGEYPFLDAPNRTPKRMIASEFMSRINFTGVYFPFTSETNLNDEAPSALIPSTIAHELAHQRGVAAEQEANFVSVRACMTSGNDVYAYSGALLAYIHLGNALYDADRDLWRAVYDTLSDEVKADLDANNLYWEKYKTKESDAAETVYEAFLSSYDQTLGMKSYGACVDLLTNDYIARRSAEEESFLTNVDGIS